MGTRLVTPRLVLEPTTTDHAEDLWVAIQGSLPELARWMAWAVDPVKERTVEFVERAAHHWAGGRPEEWHFTIFHEGTVGGHISLLRSNLLVASSELGYWLRSDLSGRGLMTEAAAAVVEHGFGTAGLHRIELRAAVDNVGSIRVAEKVGFLREGLGRDGTRARDGWMDVELFALLATDERLRPATG